MNSLLIFLKIIIQLLIPRKSTFGRRRFLMFCRGVKGVHSEHVARCVTESNVDIWQAKAIIRITSFERPIFFFSKIIYGFRLWIGTLNRMTERWKSCSLSILKENVFDKIYIKVQGHRVETLGVVLKLWSSFLQLSTKEPFWPRKWPLQWWKMSKNADFENFFNFCHFGHIFSSWFCLPVQRLPGGLFK